MKWLDLPVAGGAKGTIRLPGSKSISNRILLLAALAQGITDIHDLLVSDDTDRMLLSLRKLGVSVDQIGDNDYQIVGCQGKLSVRKADLFLGNAGTAFRPLVAVLALMNGNYQLSGVARMHERPIADLVDTMRQLGAKITYLNNEGFPPLKIRPADINIVNKHSLTVKGDVSSQFLSSLLMALPLTGKPATIQVLGDLISRPYVELTLGQMKRFGIQVECDEYKSFELPGGQFYHSPGKVNVEGDASSASYFLAAGAIGAGPVRVEGVGSDSLQGDVRFIDVLKKMGAQITLGNDWIESRQPIANQTGKPLKPVDIDCNHIPDAAMTIAIVALFANGTSTLRNIASWRLKETDRLLAMAKELRKLGATVEEGNDFLRIQPPINKITPHAVIDTYDDHRMAMCFSLASFGAPVRISDPGCVSKTFPDYFKSFAQITHPD